MKLVLFSFIFLLCSINYSQDDLKFTIKGAKTVANNEYVSKRKALDCNKDLEWTPGSSIIYHKKSGKPYTGTCVSYYDNRKLERKINFILGKENGECFTYYKNGNVKIKSIYDNGIENGTLGAFYRV